MRGRADEFAYFSSAPHFLTIPCLCVFRAFHGALRVRLIKMGRGNPGTQHWEVFRSRIMDILAGREKSWLDSQSLIMGFFSAFMGYESRSGLRAWDRSRQDDCNRSFPFSRHFWARGGFAGVCLPQPVCSSGSYLRIPL